MEVSRGEAACRLQASEIAGLTQELSALLEGGKLMLVGGGGEGSGAGSGAGGDGPKRLVERAIEPSKLRLAPELKREVEAVRREWTASTNALTMAMADAASAAADGGVLRDELESCEAQLSQALTLTLTLTLTLSCEAQLSQALPLTPNP